MLCWASNEMKSIYRGAFLAGAILAPARAQLQFYVSTTGNDSNPGTAGQPVATPQRAQQLVASAKSASGGTLPSDVLVNIAPGTYYLSGPLNITLADGGDSAHSVQWVGSSGTEPTLLSAGSPVSGWQLLSGYTDVYTASVPSSIFPQFFIRQMWDSNGNRRLLSRSPIMIAAATGQTGVVAQAGQVTATAGQLAEAELVMWHDWVSSINKIASWNPANNTLLVQGQGGDPYFNAGGNRYALQNVADPATLQPGTFYFSPSARVITYRALPGEDPTSPTAQPLIAERLPYAVLMSGVEGNPVLNTHIVNITMAHTGAYLEESCISSGCSGQSVAELPYAAFHASWASGVSVSGCEIFGTGQYAAWFHQGTTDSSITSTWLHDLGAGGVRVGVPAGGVAPDSASLATNISITDCTIEDGGHVVQAGTGVLAEQAAEVTILHNHIHHLLYTGISTGWTWGYAPDSDFGHLIGWNRIHDIFQGVLSDGGCIYNLGRSPNTTIINNVCHDVNSYGYGGWGLYTDEGSSNVTLRDNIVFNTKSASFHQHYGTNNVITNNIFAFPGAVSCGTGVLASGCDNSAIRSSQHSPGSGGDGTNSSFTLTTNIVLMGSPNAWNPANANNTAVYYTTMQYGLKNMTIGNNIYWAYNGVPAPASQLSFGPTQDPMSWAQWQGYGKDETGVIADPMFTDPGAFDFSFASQDSPALRMGFTPIDTSTVGPRTVNYRLALATASQE